MMLTNAFICRSRHALWIAVAVAAGCSANHVIGEVDASSPENTGAAGTGGTIGNAAAGSGGSIGNPAAGSGGGAIASDAGRPMTDAAPQIEVGPLGPTQSWTGYIENYKFPSGSDTIKLTFATDSQGFVVGTIDFGQGTAPAPATDPNIGYPPDYPPFADSTMFIEEGYPYPIGRGTLTAGRLQLSVQLNQLWTGWCALQTSPDGNGACVPNLGSMVDSQNNRCALLRQSGSAGGGAGGGSGSQESIPVDCAKLALCRSPGACTCVGSGACTVNDAGNPFIVDVFVTDNTASGSVNGDTSAFAGHNVHFTKD